MRIASPARRAGARRAARSGARPSRSCSTSVRGGRSAVRSASVISFGRPGCSLTGGASASSSRKSEAYSIGTVI